MARGIEYPLGIGQLDLALPRGEGMPADQFECLQIADLKFMLVQANQDTAADACRSGGIPGASHLDGGVISHRAGALLEVAEALQG